MEGKKNIALFMAMLENDYSNAILQGALKGARECDTNLLVFPVDVINANFYSSVTNGYRYQYNTMCSFMNNYSIDGVIIEYGTVASFLTDDEKIEFRKMIGDKPSILLAEKAKGYKSICIDNVSGLIEVIEHIIDVHNCTKIAYLSGPKENFDAELRLRGYIDTLKKHNLFLGEDWIAYGNFSEFIRNEVEELLSKHPDMDALVCANDAMAIAAANILKEKGYVLGKDIVVTGYDNLAAGFLSDPAITTVDADPAELSRKAVHDLMDYENVIEEQTINTSMVCRMSCGCDYLESDGKWKELLGMSTDWRTMAKEHMDENIFRHNLERELGNIARELVFNLKDNHDRYNEILSMLRRFGVLSSALLLYDDFIEHKKDDVWEMPQTMNLVAFYDSQEEPNHVLDKGDIVVPVKDLFDWGMVRDGKRHEIIMLPLFFGQMQIGLLCVEAAAKNFLYAYDMAGQISTIFYTIAMNEKQEQLNKDLEKANQSKSHFLANMSHEIRTPINAIIGFNEMILRENKDDSIAEYARDVKNAADALLLLVNDTLDFSKIEAGKMELIIGEYRLLELLNTVIAMMTERAEKKGLALFLEYDEELPSVLEGDAGRLQQIIINLLSNAIKYTEKGKVTLKVSGRVKNDNLIMQIKVSDTGIGIKEEDIGRLFNRFERIEEKRNRNIEGTGLGINITTGLLRLMGSELRVKSEYAVGSEFYFIIKQKVIDSTSLKESADSKTNPKEDVYIPDFKAPDVNILVVDDNFLNRKVIVSLLKDTLINVDQAESGKACIDMVNNKEYDLILLDHMMPEMDGIETLDKLINNNLIDISKTPVIALTANAIAGAKELYLSKGFLAYLAKPVRPKDLYELIIKYVDKIVR